LAARFPLAEAIVDVTGMGTELSRLVAVAFKSRAAMCAVKAIYGFLFDLLGMGVPP